MCKLTGANHRGVLSTQGERFPIRSPFYTLLSTYAYNWHTNSSDNNRRLARLAEKACSTRRQSKAHLLNLTTLKQIIYPKEKCLDMSSGMNYYYVPEMEPLYREFYNDWDVLGLIKTKIKWNFVQTRVVYLLVTIMLFIVNLTYLGNGLNNYNGIMHDSVLRVKY